MKTIKIGNQIWSKRNLKVDHYRNGDIIPEVQGSKEWSKQTTGAWCYYENKKIKKHGKLYNWYAVNDPRGLAPEGWHIPTIEEFETLSLTVNENSTFLKDVGIDKKKGVGTNKSGFSALLSGYRNGIGFFNSLGYSTYHWSSTEYNNSNAHYLQLNYYDSHTHLNINNKEQGYSVRLIKD